jgi:hypothetical protein
MKKTIGLLALAMVACTNGQGDVDVVTSNPATFPLPTELPGALGQMSFTTEADVKLDVHGELASMAKVGTLSLGILRDSVSGQDLARVDQVTATIAAADGTLPARPLARVVVAPSTTEAELVRLMADSQALGYLQEGPVVVHLTLTGDLPSIAGGEA